jgi:putative RNA 2'-phosphotransferase
MSKSDTSNSKFLSLVLRHAPEKIGVELDENGWIDVEILLEAMARNGKTLTRSDLERIVTENDKKRFAFSENGLRIRANQGHSVEVDLALQPCIPPELLFHGTPEGFVASILSTGLNKGQRHHVHLSADRLTATKVGERRGLPIILEVQAGEMHRTGHIFYKSENGVWLVDAVPAVYISAPNL